MCKNEYEELLAYLWDPCIKSMSMSMRFNTIHVSIRTHDGVKFVIVNICSKEAEGADEWP